MRPLSQREEAIRLYLEDGLSYGKIATRLQVSRNTVKSWIRRYRELNRLTKNDITESQKTIPKSNISPDDYEKRIKQLEMEVELLRDFSLRGRKKVDKRIIYRVILKNKGKYPISKMCVFFGVSRSGYYDWLKRKQEPDKDLFLKDLISECQIKHKRLYGYRRVVIWLLKEYGLIVNHKAVLRIMNKYNLLSVTRRKGYYRRMLNAQLRYPNILQRDFKANEPNQKWVTDITYIKTKQGMLFLSIIKDLYDNYIVSYKMSKMQDYGLVDRTIKDAKSKEKSIEGVILHSDQGYQYTSYRYNELAKELKITPSMSRPGTPLDNACAENFFSILKSECIYREKPQTFEEAQMLIEEYIQYYNYERIQVKTKMTPYEIRSHAA